MENNVTDASADADVEHILGNENVITIERWSFSHPKMTNC